MWNMGTRSSGKERRKMRKKGKPNRFTTLRWLHSFYGSGLKIKLECRREKGRATENTMVWCQVFSSFHLYWLLLLKLALLLLHVVRVCSGVHFVEQPTPVCCLERFHTWFYYVVTSKVSPADSISLTDWILHFFEKRTHIRHMCMHTHQ